MEFIQFKRALNAPLSYFLIRLTRGTININYELNTLYLVPNLSRLSNTNHRRISPILPI